ncbi:hypothetical protein TRVA0_008S01860 [Trichomonascus vanleenenianus]|uniref:uncharacterized protein n=1 Tax=Trichomonascus vanleenenianus TaxID=2268995 RepID=UPI003EC9B8DD
MGCLDRLEYDPKWFPLELQHEITLRSHTPPNLMEAKTLLRDEILHSKPPVVTDDPRSPLYNVLDHPPLPGQQKDVEIKIKLRKEIRPVKEGRQRLFLAEVTAAHVSHLDEEADGMQVVAEVFDPLTVMGRHASVLSDLSYISIATIYELLKDLQGSLIPKYYGSYTMKVPVENHMDRDVRVILREYIEGKGLNKIKPKSLNREERQHLMEKIVAAEQKFDGRGVMIRMNYSPSSVILVDKNCMKIVVWRFNCAIFGSDLWQQGNYVPGRWASPLYKWSQMKLRVRGFDVFVDWDWNSWMKEKYGTAQQLFSPSKGSSGGSKCILLLQDLNNLRRSMREMGKDA